MGLGDRITEWIEERRKEWGDALGTWLLDRLAGGMTKSLEGLEPGAIEAYSAGLDKVIADPNIPEDIKVFLRKANTTGNPISAIGGMIFMVLQSAGVVLGGSQPLSNILRYQQDSVLRTFRFDPLNAVTAWRRDPIKYAGIFEDLTEQGWTADRIEALKFVTQFLPNADEQTLWLAREVFEPAMIDKYGLDDELPIYTATDFAKIGVTPEQMTNKWRAHWQHASWIQVVEMLYRGLITEDDVRQWFRLVEIPPYWRQLLIDSAYAWPTRVDVRRWWDMRTITEDRLRELYAGMGYRGENLDDYVTWTKVYTEFPSLLARWQKGWITLEDIRRELRALGIPDERIEVFIQEKIEAEEPERTAADRSITITDIYKGVRTERISRAQAIELLQELGFDEDEADYKLAVNVPEDEVESVALVRKLSKADILAGLKAGVLPEAEARTKLLELRYVAGDVQLLLDIFNASIKPPAEGRQRQASKADILLAVKKALITPEEGYLMLIDVGFTPEAAEFILFVKAESSPFSPVTFGEFKDLTSKWRKATGMATKELNDKIKKAGDELVRITAEVQALEESARAEEFSQVDADVIPADAAERLKEINLAKNRALAEQLRIQQEYNGLVAEFKQTEG
jgi:hypothetical protein